MDQNINPGLYHPSIPHWAQQRKVSSIKLHLTGAISHGQGIDGFSYFHANCDYVRY